FFYSSRDSSSLRSFPTRRSSDLSKPTGGLNDDGSSPLFMYRTFSISSDSSCTSALSSLSSLFASSSSPALSLAVHAAKKETAKTTNTIPNHFFIIVSPPYFPAVCARSCFARSSCNQQSTRWVADSLV